jgi:photosystem II stability/assembly factor-like uncharacterized protein
MKKIFLSLFLLVISISLSFAQGDVWSYTKDFATVTNPNAICKDATGNIWYASKTGTAGIIVVNSSGTALSFSPIKTVGAVSITGCQGLQTDPVDGNIVAIVNGNVLVRFNVTTGAVMANATVPAIGTNTELSNFGIDQDGNIYFTHITQPSPLEIYSSAFVKVMNVADIATDAPQCMAVTVSNNCNWMWNNTDGSNMQGVQVFAGKTGAGSGIHHFRAGMNYDATAKKYSFSKDSLFSFSRYIFTKRGDIESFTWEGSIKAGSPAINAWVCEKGGKALKITLGADLKGSSAVVDSIAVTGQISTPRGIVLTSSKVALIADYDKNRIAQFSAASIVWNNWLFVKDLLNGTNEVSSHGLAIDKQGVIWVCTYYNWNTVHVPGKKLASIIRFKPDYTVKDTIWRLKIGASYDTLGLGASSYLGRGISLDDDGNILYCGGVSSGNTLYRINAVTGEGMNRVNPGVGSLTSAAADKFGHVFIRDVASSTPKGIMIYPKDFNDNSIPNIAVLPADCPITISRCLTVSPDGNDIYVGSTGGVSVGVFHSDNGSDGPYTFKRYIGTYPNGQIVAFDPKGRLWIGTNDYLRYDCWDLSTMTLVDGISPASATDKTLGRIYTPRGIAFTADGKNILTADFDGQTVQRWTNDVSLQTFANVTFMVNTSTVPDTIGAKSVVQIRGDDPLFGPWSDAGLKMTRVQGDYWKATARLTKGKVIPYKFFTNGPGLLDKGWENNLTQQDGNRWLTVPNSDTTLPLQFVNGSPTTQTQYWNPLAHGADSVAVMFRINMQGNEGFNKATQFVAVRGAFPASGGDWSKNFLLTQEKSHGNGGQADYDGTNFWSGVTVLPKSMVGTTIGYKYVTLATNSTTAAVAAWEGTADRSYKVGGDTTIAWTTWESKPIVAFKGSDTVDVNFRVDLSKAIRAKGYTPGDTVYVSYGWSSTGKDLAGNSPARVTMTKTGITGNIYIATGKAITKIGTPMYYQYYITKNGQDIRETFFNFEYTDVNNASLGERRSIIPAKTNNVVDTITSSTDSHRQPVFPNTQKLSKAIALTLTCDLRPAYYSVKKGLFMNDIQGTTNIGNADSVYLDGVWVNGPMVGGWAGWGGALRDSVKQKMWDDGTHGDAVAGDHIYTNQYTLGPTYSDTRANIGQEFKYGVYGGDNESGFGLNHIENIDDAAATYTLNTQFGSINPNRYIGWDFDKQAAKGDYSLQTSGITNTIRGLKVIDENVVWASCNGGVVLRTTNGGITWESKTTDALYNNYTIAATSATTAWVWGTLTSVGTLGQSTLWKTTDGGSTWVKQYENTNTYADDIIFFDANNGVAIGDPDDGTNFVIVTTTNGGTTWTRIASAKAPAAAGASGSANSYASVGDNAWFGTYGSGSIKLYKTTDKGASWNAYSVPNYTDGYSTYMDFKDANNGVAVNTEGKVSLTTDGGLTWGTPVLLDATGLRNVDYIAGTKSIVITGGGTSAGVVWTSGDDGKKFVKATIPTVPQLRNVKFASGTTGWVVGNSGTILKFQGPNLVSVKQIDTKIPQEFSLSQNFPNPFNPETSIRYTLAKDVKVSLRIYDMLGREVKVLVDDNQIPGSYEIRFNANQFASGVYFYHLKAGNYSSIKKMMFMK